jgi:hypothetical protein
MLTLREKMNKTQPPQRTWLVAVAAISVGVIGASVFSVIPYAEWKASVRSSFLLQSAKTDRAIEILQSEVLRSAFSIYFVFILGMIPFLVSCLRPKSLWMSLAAIVLLLSPMLWYGGQISHVAGKFVNWNQMDPELGSAPSVARPVAGWSHESTRRLEAPASGLTLTNKQPE